MRSSTACRRGLEGPLEDAAARVATDLPAGAAHLLLVVNEGLVPHVARVHPFTAGAARLAVCGPGTAAAAGTLVLCVLHACINPSRHHNFRALRWQSSHGFRSGPCFV